jgi:hypothetical protein
MEPPSRCRSPARAHIARDLSDDLPSAVFFATSAPSTAEPDDHPCDIVLDLEEGRSFQRERLPILRDRLGSIERPRPLPLDAGLILLLRWKLSTQSHWGKH